MTRLGPGMKALLVARLRELRAAGELTTAVVRASAAGAGVTERTLWRWLAVRDADQGRVSCEHPGHEHAGPGEPAAHRGRYELTSADVDAFVAWQGNVAAVHRERHAAQPGGPSLRGLQRAFATQLTPGQRAGLVEGAEGRRRYEVYLRWAPSARNAMWEGDHVELPVLVLAPRAQRPAKPWATLFLDAYSRMIMGWAISLRPTSATVLAALRAGIVIDPDRGPFGGLPAVLRPDQGLEFSAAALRRSCAALGIEFVPTPGYTPHLKGKIERANRTLDQEFLSGLPFHTDGPRSLDGALLGPDAEPMSLGLFVDRFAEWVRGYNTTRVHSELSTTPLVRWGEDATPLRELDPAQLRWMLMADVERTVNRDGIHFGGVRFIAPELNELVGERLQVRYTPHDLRQIELFRGDHWLATAFPQDTLTSEQRDAVLERRRADAAELGRRHRRASRRARAQLAPITKPGEVEDTTVITNDTARTERDRRRRRRGDEGPDYAALARLARTDLLDLKSDFAYWNPEFREAADSPAPVDLDQPHDTEQDTEQDTERRVGGQDGEQG
ncbi:Mu transposase C-terminal domain-containing protein [Pseudonocardia sp. ICBG1034]|uniref:Mu transposase C-terminal domain-containing protein n=1 Tax=Pseudonocardia sp. ICBG1034 TaxID=2844381 RepID=UPI001CCF2521|nr:Mu transposase C-terminal domain-containing protein [Pseudonocardia sp. ICBG1034]